MHHPRTHDRAAFGSRPQDPNCSFHLGKFRHTPPSRPSWRPRPEPASSKIRLVELLVRLEVANYSRSSCLVSCVIGRTI
jgi:hypothetical protein